MAEVTQDQFVDYIKNISVLELSQLVKKLEAELGVSAAAAMPMGMPMAGGGGAAAAAPAEEKTEFNVTLTEAGGDKFVSDSPAGLGGQVNGSEAGRFFRTECYNAHALREFPVGGRDGEGASFTEDHDEVLHSVDAVADARGEVHSDGRVDHVRGGFLGEQPQPATVLG